MCSDWLASGCWLARRWPAEHPGTLAVDAPTGLPLPMPAAREAFRPCIDLHDGAVKQIVGGTLKDSDAGEGMAAGVVENFVSEKPPAFYSSLYKEHALVGGHVIKLGDGNEDAALEALRAWPGGMQIGGGITPESAGTYLEAGASHVIVTSYVFRDGQLDQARLDEMVAAVGKDRLVLDLSCRKGEDGEYYVVTDRWQKFTDLKVDGPTLASLSSYCDEFLVHGEAPLFASFSQTGGVLLHLANR